MGFPNQVWRCTAEGTLWGGVETWSAGLWIGGSGIDAGTPTQAWADQLAARWKTFFTNSFVAVSNVASLTKIALQLYSTAGTVNTNDTIFSTAGLPAAGANTGNVPPQLALAFSFKSARSRGQAANGRFYLPVPVHGLTSTGHILSTDMSNMITPFKTFIDGINTDFAGISGGALRVILASRGKPVKDTTTGHWTYPNPGAIENVTQLRIGDVFDTVDRRRNQLREAYTTAAVA